MIFRAAALCSTDETAALPATCSCFINQENAGMAQYDLVHQFKEQGFHVIIFASGKTNALYVGGFLYADSSTPSNFRIFCFSRARAKLRQLPSRLSYLPPDSSQGKKEIFRRNQSIVEAISSRTFQISMDLEPKSNYLEQPQQSFLAKTASAHQVSTNYSP
jgi:hypothetical protein